MFGSRKNLAFRRDLVADPSLGPRQSNKIAADGGG
jgi:hypothetical protein